MKSYNSTVKCYKRKNGEQYLITLKQGHPFNENENVFIISESEINEFKKDNINLENTLKLRDDTIHDLSNEITKNQEKIKELEEKSKETDDLKEKMAEMQNKYDKLLKDMQEKYDKSLNDNDKLRNTKDHLQERFNKSQEEVIKLERELNSYRIAITKVQSLNFMDRLLNRLPEEIKQLPNVENQ